METKALGKVKDHASTTKEKAQVAEVQASKATKEALEAFRSQEEYRHEVLVSYKDAFQQSLELCKKQSTKKFLVIKIGKLMMDLRVAAKTL